MKRVLLAAVAIIFLAAFLTAIPTSRNGIEIEKGGIDMKEANATLITVYDNYQHETGMQTGWGFGCVVKADKTILFDTGGDSPALLDNMGKAGIDPKDIDLVVLSHIHGDHTGGLAGFLERNPNVTVYIPASFPDSFRDSISQAGARHVDVSGPVKITESVGTTGELGTWIKEQSLLISSPKGLIVVTGCAHPGIVHIVEEAKRVTGKDVYLVIGGFHLGGASNETLRDIIASFRRLGVQKAAPCHCSGDRARQLFREEYGEDYIANGVGKVIEVWKD